MKTFKNIAWSLAALLALASCEDGIDSISKVDPGEDKSAPVVTINYPVEGTKIRVVEDVTTLKIQLNVVDDIEIGKVVVKLDGTTLTEYSAFKDYRHAVEAFVYEGLTNGVHVVTVEATDLSGKNASASVNFEKIEPYRPVFDGEVFYMPFDGDFLDLVSIAEAAKVGSPTFVTGRTGMAYGGAADSYLTFNLNDLTTPLGAEFSAAFWYKLNASPDRAGILVISPDNSSNPSENIMTSGFRFFREGSTTSQTFKLNAGFGSDGAWFDGGAAASFGPDGTWVHLAFTISPTACAVYINGEVVKDGSFDGISWADCTLLSIGSGAPFFTGWSHYSDVSLIDELRIFNKALSPGEVKAAMAAQ